MSASVFENWLLWEVLLTDFALVVHGVVVVFVVFPARLAGELVGHLLSVLALLLVRLLQLSGFAGFRFLGHGALLAGLARAFGGRLTTLLAGLAEAGLAWVLLTWVLLVLLVLSIAVLIWLAILISALLLLVVALVVLLAVTLTWSLLAIIVLAALLTVLLLLTVLRHSFGKLRLKDQVTS